MVRIEALGARIHILDDHLAFASVLQTFLFMIRSFLSSIHLISLKHLILQIGFSLAQLIGLASSRPLPAGLPQAIMSLTERRVSYMLDRLFVVAFSFL